jgi:SAM-dependent methyltransferase
MSINNCIKTRSYDYFDVIAGYLKTTYNPKTVIDVGCYKGRLVESFLNHGCEAFGCDLSAEYIGMAPVIIRNRLRILDITKEELPFKNQEFDMAIMLDVIEHLPEFDFALSELSRVLKRGGYLYISTPTQLSCTLTKCEDPTHINVHGKNYWLDLLGSHNFKYHAEFPKKEKDKAITTIERKKSKVFALMLKIYLNDYFPNLRTDAIFEKL